MVSARFTRPRALIRPPSWCKSLKEDLPILIPPVGPDSWQGFASWMDLPAEDHPDIAMYVAMARVDTTWKWTGQQTIGDFVLVVILERLADPNPWQVTVEIWRSPVIMEDHTFPEFDLTTEPIWETPLLTHVALPGEGKVSAQVST